MHMHMHIQMHPGKVFGRALDQGRGWVNFTLLSILREYQLNHAQVFHIRGICIYAYMHIQMHPGKVFGRALDQALGWVNFTLLSIFTEY